VTVLLIAARAVGAIICPILLVVIPHECFVWYAVVAVVVATGAIDLWEHIAGCECRFLTPQAHARLSKGKARALENHKPAVLFNSRAVARNPYDVKVV
jgi:hypothetical protein